MLYVFGLACPLKQVYVRTCVTLCYRATNHSSVVLLYTAYVHCFAAMLVVVLKQAVLTQLRYHARRGLR
jgi:hypothetical protein